MQKEMMESLNVVFMFEGICFVIVQVPYKLSQYDEPELSLVDESVGFLVESLLEPIECVSIVIIVAIIINVTITKTSNFFTLKFFTLIFTPYNALLYSFFQIL